MTTAVVDSPENQQGLRWWFLDTLVVEHRCAPGMDTVVVTTGTALRRRVLSDRVDNTL